MKSVRRRAGEPRHAAALPALAMLVLVALAALVTHEAAAAPPRAARPAGRPAAPPVPLAPLPMLPSIPRVRVEILKEKLVVVEEVNLPRGDWKAEALDFYVAFGAPGAPRAVDAQLIAVEDGALEPAEEEPGEALPVERAPRRPPGAHPLLGRETMAGVVVHLKREAFARALTPGSMAALRVRTALDLPDEDAQGARGVVVRLGASRGTPLTLGRLSVVARPGAPPPRRAEAKLCGPDADATPLAVALLPRPKLSREDSRAAGGGGPSTLPVIAPVLAVRHASDDLCVRFWSSP